jgi:hypothetical protein
MRRAVVIRFLAKPVIALERSLDWSTAECRVSDVQLWFLAGEDFLFRHQMRRAVTI